MAKVLVSLEDSLLHKIDAAARARGLSRSSYLAELAAKDLEYPLGPGRQASVHEALASLDDLFADAPPGEAVQEVRAERDGR